MKHCSLIRCTIVCALLLFMCGRGYGQLTVNNATNANEAVQTYLLGAGVIATNITFSGNNDQVASFNCNNCNLNIGSGVVLSSGDAATSSGPNNSGSSSTSYNTTSNDPDLNAISAVSVNDAAILQFDFIPTGDSLIFNYVFGSDEYPNFINGTFNDSFGFFLSGPGISGSYENNAINIATIPGTSLPVSINNLNNGTTGTNGPCEYCQYYIHNGDGATAPYNSNNTYIQADGFTTVLQAYAEVVCGETYHIKLCIADGGDWGYNSWVFLEAGSFQSNTLDLSFNQPGLAPTDNSMYEGCEGQSIIFTRPAGAQGDLSFTIEYSGTAQNGVDYETLPGTVELPVGVDTVYVPVIPMNDAISEGVENIILTVDGGIACAGSITLQLEIYELAPLSVTLSDLVVGCTDDAILNPVITGGYGNYEVVWEGYGTGDPFTLEISDNATISYTVSDICAVETFSGTVNVTVPDSPEIIFDLGTDIEATCFEAVTITPVVNGGTGTFEYSWEVNGTEMGNDPSFTTIAIYNNVVSLTVTDECSGSTTDEVGFEIAQDPISVSLGNDLDLNCLQTANLVPVVSGGNGNYEYVWEVNGEVVSNSSIYSIPASDNTIVLTVTDECGAAGSDQLVMEIVNTSLTISTTTNLTVDCLSNFTISPNVTGGVGGNEYTWSYDGNSSSSSSITYFTSEDMQVMVYVEDDCGNSDSETINITIAPSELDVNITANDTDVCPGDPVVLTAAVSGAIGSPSYDWTVSGSNASVTISTEETESYSVTITDDCNFTATDSYTVEVLDQDFPLTTPDQTVCFGVYAQDVAQGGFLPYDYDYSDDSLNYENGDFIALYNGYNYITVTDHCGYSSTMELYTKPCSIIIPNIFTPDGNDANQSFEIIGLNGFPGSELIVFNRWGNEVYRDGDYNNKWDGGELESGTYFYVLERVDGEKFSGTITLLRK